MTLEGLSSFYSRGVGRGDASGTSTERHAALGGAAPGECGLTQERAQSQPISTPLNSIRCKTQLLVAVPLKFASLRLKRAAAVAALQARAAPRWTACCTNTARLAIDETVILLHPPLPLVGVSIAMEREHQQNDSLANG